LSDHAKCGNGRTVTVAVDDCAFDCLSDGACSFTRVPPNPALPADIPETSLLARLYILFSLPSVKIPIPLVMPPPHKIAGWGLIRSLLCLSPLLFFVPWLAVRQHYPNGKTHTAFDHRTYRLLISFLLPFQSFPCL
jgi:hypothetical protein